jgi:replicative DNA helicase
MSLAAHQPVVDRIPPHNIEAEMGVIGSVLFDREMMAVVGEIVKPSDFYAHVHETIFDSLQTLFDRGEPMDKIALAEELRRRDALERVGGLSYINTLMDTVQTAASAKYYATIVREKSILRALIHAATEIGKLGYEAEEDVEGALDRSQQLVYEISEHRGHADFTPIKHLMKSAFDHIDRLYHMRGDRTGLTAGFRDIDDMTTGFQPGNFILIAARPGMGKTSFALNMAVSAAREASEPVAFFSLEMSNNELIQRLICAEARLSMHNLRRGNIKEHQWEDISRAMGVLNDLPIYLDDTGALTVNELRARCRRLKTTGGLAAIFVDYLQLLAPGPLARHSNRNEELSEICRTLKVTAKDLEVPIIACAQLNRGVEARQDKRPMLADLRDCLAGRALVTNADTGERIPMREIVRRKLRFNVWAMDGRLQLVRKPIVNAWEVGEKDIFRVTTRSGRTIECTDGHRFLTMSGWARLRQIPLGDCVCVPHFLTARREELTCRRMRSLHGSPAPGSSTTMAIFPEADVAWDEIAKIEPLGKGLTYDLTVGDLHNFCVDDILTHNSGALEQESDIVAFLYREGYYSRDGADPTMAGDPTLTEFIIAKHRNGPTGTVKLRFEKEYTLFVPYADESRYPAP